MTDMTMYLGGVLLPKPTPEGFKRIDQLNGTTVTTLANSIYTDFTNMSRTWQLTYDTILQANYQILLNLFYRQNTEVGYLFFYFPGKNIYAKAFLDIAPADLAYNDAIIRNFSVTLREANPVS